MVQPGIIKGIRSFNPTVKALVLWVKKSRWARKLQFCDK